MRIKWSTNENDAVLLCPRSTTTARFCFFVAFFDVCVFKPLAPSNCRASLNVIYRCHENIKRRSYEQRVREVEHGSFIPLVFSASGGMAPAATTTFKRLTSLTSNKQQQDHNKTIEYTWIRCLLSFSLVRSSEMCLRGARSSYHHPARPVCDTPLDVAGHVPTWTVNSLYWPLLSFNSSHSYINVVVQYILLLIYISPTIYSWWFLQS